MGITNTLTDGDGCEKVASCVERINPWSNPKLTIGEAMDIRIKQARQHVENLCVQKAKLEAMDWLNHPYHEVQRLLNGEPYPF